MELYEIKNARICSGGGGTKSVLQRNIQGRRTNVVLLQKKGGIYNEL